MPVPHESQVLQILMKKIYINVVGKLKKGGALYICKKQGMEQTLVPTRWYVEGGYCKEVCTALFIDKTSDSCVIIKIFFKN